ncbi:MAG TPA: pyridoxamine 5'-phosphate oxidase family protein [Paenirhodobacter sp.]
MNDTDETLSRALWGLVTSERTVMLSLNAADALPRPMTALVVPGNDERANPVAWFYAGQKDPLVAELRQTGAANAPAFFTFTARDHHLFATVRGAIAVSEDAKIRARFGTPEAASWFPDPDEPPVLLRFDPADAEIWDADFSFVDGMKLLLGAKAEDTLATKVAKIAY